MVEAVINVLERTLHTAFQNAAKSCVGNLLVWIIAHAQRVWRESGTLLSLPASVQRIRRFTSLSKFQKEFHLLIPKRAISGFQLKKKKG